MPVLVVNAAVHLFLVPGLLGKAPDAAVLFLVLGVAFLALAGVLVEWDTSLAWSGAAGVNALALSAYVLSRSVGLPQLGDQVGNWAEPLGLVAIAAEALLVIEGASVLLSGCRREH